MWRVGSHSLIALLLYIHLTVNSTSAAEKCASTVNGEEVCEKKLILEDKFDTLNLNNWRHEVRLSDYPDYEFNFYNKTDSTAFVQDGVLHIKPIVLKGDISSGTIDLNRYPPDAPLCTDSPASDVCRRTAHNGFRILPPVVSARLRSTVRFRYGTVTIRAKMPLGDWIYPQLELTPVSKKYGKTSGTIVIAIARGNLYLKMPTGDQRLDFGTRWLEGGLYPGEYNPLKTSTMLAKFDPKGWYSKYHDFKLEWNHDGLKWYVDDKLVGKGHIPKPSKGFLPWAKNKLAPFDEEMELALGVGVGGIQRFPDGIISNGKPKPWRNLGPKGMFNFSQARNDWHPTWQGNNAALRIDSVAVWTNGMYSDDDDVTVNDQETAIVTETEPETTDTTFVTETDPDVTIIADTDPETSIEIETNSEVTIVTETDPDTTIVTESDPEITFVTETDPEATIGTETDPEVTIVTETDRNTTFVTETDPEITIVTETDQHTTFVTETKPNFTILKLDPETIPKFTNTTNPATTLSYRPANKPVLKPTTTFGTLGLSRGVLLGPGVALLLVLQCFIQVKSNIYIIKKLFPFSCVAYLKLPLYAHDH